MTHPTDKELDALVEQQTRAANKRDEFEALMNADRTVRAITALRAQLAEADAMIEAQAKDHAENNIRLAEMSHRISQLEGMVMSGQGEQIRLAADLLQAKIECSEANARADQAEAALAEAEEKTKDAISTLEAWFDRKELGHKAVDQAVLDAASGYLRTSRSGGMPQKKSDLVLAVFQDMARLGAFADLFARAAKTQSEAERAAQIEADAGIAQSFHDAAIEWAKKIRGLSEYIGETDSSRIATAIRSQPHDRSALARYRETVLRDLAEVIRGWRNDVLMTGEECANAILAMIDKENQK